MSGAAKRAKTLTPEMLDHLLRYVAGAASDPLRDYVIILLSFKAGLRAAEIAGLDWADVTDASGHIGQPVKNQVTGEVEFYFEVPGDIAKKGRPRTIPMHASLQATLRHLQASLGPLQTKPNHPVIRGRRGPRMDPNTLVQYLRRLYTQAGFQGCSSHSGRRTLITALAQRANQHGCSLMDVQRIAGHADIATTEVYVEASPNVGKMMRSM